MLTPRVSYSVCATLAPSFHLLMLGARYLGTVRIFCVDCPPACQTRNHALGASQMALACLQRDYNDGICTPACNSTERQGVERLLASPSNGPLVSFAGAV